MANQHIFKSGQITVFIFNFKCFNILTHSLILGIIKTKGLLSLSEYPIKYLELALVLTNFR